MPKWMEDRRNILLGLVLVVVTMLAYLPAIREGGFIWDDDDYVTNNEALSDASGLKEIWTDPTATPQYYPLVHTTYWIEYRIWGLDPTGYHVVNILLHALAAILLWILLRRLKLPGAWLGAALFALHPVHVESVAWITERKNVLSGVFYLGAALTYMKWFAAKAQGEKATGGYLAAFVLFVCALLSKTVTATLPAALILVMWWKNWLRNESVSETSGKSERSAWRHILPLVPFFAVGLMLSYNTAALEKYHVGAAGSEWELSFIERCLIAGRAVWFYFGKLLWPTELCFNYPRWEIDEGAWWQYLFPLSAAAAVVLLWLKRRRIGRGPLVAVLFFGGTLLPALGFFDVYPMRYSFVADHFQYLPSIGILALLSAVVVRICKGRAFRPILTGVIMVLLAILTAQQCRIYHNLETLWIDTIKKNPSSWMAHINLGQQYVLKDKPAAAVPLFERAIQLNPDEVEARYNLGVALARMGREEEAIRHYQTALEIDPDEPQIYSNMGAAMARLGRFDEAVTYYRKALEIKPELAPTLSNLGSSLLTQGRIDEAIQHHEKAVALMPDLGSMHLKYGEALQAAGRVRAAQDQYRTAVSLDPSLADAHDRLGLIAVEDKLLPAALHHFQRAVRAAPNHAAAHSHLSVLLAGQGRNDEAIDLLRRAVKLAPGNAEYHNNLGVMLVRAGNRAEALKVLQEAVRLNPEYAEAKKNLDDLRTLLEKRSDQ